MKTVGIAIIMPLLMVGVPGLAQGVDEGEEAERNALPDRISLHRLLAMQFGGNYLSSDRVNMMDARRPRLDHTGVDSDRMAPEVPGTIAQEALHFRALQHRCVSETIPATACYRMIHHFPGSGWLQSRNP